MRGISISRLEKNAGVGNGVVAKWDENEGPKIGTLQKIAKALDVPLVELIGDDAN